MSMPMDSVHDLEQFRSVAYAGYGRGPAVRQDAGAFTNDQPYFRALVRRMFPADRGSLILDLGCGHGDLLNVARRAGYSRLKGVDMTIAPGDAAAAREVGIDLVAADIRRFIETIPDESVDFIVTFDVLEHLERVESLQMSKEVHRVLKPEGQWLLHVPNAQSLLFGRIRYGDITHEMAFTRDSLTQLLRLAGFSKFKFVEDAPVVHGGRSFLRLVAWKVIRVALRTYLAVETGRSGRDEVFTQGMLALVGRGQ